MDSQHAPSVQVFRWTWVPRPRGTKNRAPRSGAWYITTQGAPRDRVAQDSRERNWTRGRAPIRGRGGVI